MASIHKDPRYPKGPFYCYYVRADGLPAVRSTRKKTRREAKIVCDAIQQAEYELGDGDLSRDRLQEIFNETLKRIGQAPIERISIGKWLTEWLAGKTKLGANSRLGYEQAVREFLLYLGPHGANRRLESITEADFRGFTDQLRASGRSSATINKLTRKYLNGAFSKAVRLGKIRYNPIAGTEPEKNDSVRRDVFSQTQVVQLLEAAKGTDWEGMIVFAYSSGTRLLDCANLKWSGIDLEVGVVSFRQRKTGRETIVGLHPDFKEWLLRQVRPIDSEAPLFSSLAGRPANHRNGLSAAFKAIMKKAGVEGRLIRPGNKAKGRPMRSLSFHSFRSSAASAVFNNAALREVARRVTGHASGDGAINRYLHADVEAITAATALIPRLPRHV
jgi:integrase